ncbi:MAG: 2-C-methyl-D-erythritol 4-phosphate cytidylyltransferase [Pseudomonadota bacterium]|nr:2-C-methyl-D-erythritol 4-phosphate cytidylyltransferase [Pseudomonadota bacterium]
MGNEVSRGIWVVIPAAGVGKRMGADIPKQYLELNGRTVIEYSVKAFTGHPKIAGVVVVLGSEDSVWQTLPIADSPHLVTVEGGKERCHSVLNGLAALAVRAHSDDWVMVHDAARPCISREDINRLIDAVVNEPSGGILAIPVHDTLKRTEDGDRIAETVDRERLWRAYTPQMFRLGRLKKALEDADVRGRLVTDEASAMEAMGERPLLVEGSAENIKITRPEDLPLAEYYLGRAGSRRRSG